MIQRDIELEQAISIAISENTSTSGVLITGRRGTGKTTVVTDILKRLNKEFVNFSGKVTALGLFHFIKNNSNKIIVMDDCEGLESEIVLSFLKTILGRDKNGQAQTVSYSFRKEIESFKFSGSIIIITNWLENAQKEHLEAVKDRMYIINYDLTKEEMIDKMEKIAKSFSYRGLDTVTQEAILKGMIGYCNKYNATYSLRQMIRSFDAYITLKNNGFASYIESMIKNQAETEKV
jgi:predicted ATP-binding protein involved in virulence